MITLRKIPKMSRSPPSIIKPKAMSTVSVFRGFLCLRLEVLYSQFNVNARSILLVSFSINADTNYNRVGSVVVDA